LAEVLSNQPIGDCLHSWLVLRNIVWGSRHLEQPGRLAARLLTGHPDVKPSHFGDVMLLGKLLSTNVYFQKLKRKMNIIGQSKPQFDLSCIATNVV
jgi:hypothetical protein